LTGFLFVRKAEMTTVEPALLHTLHRMLRQQHDLTDRLERAPKQVQGAKERELKYANQLQAIGDTIKQLKMKADLKQLDLRDREQQIAKLQTQLNGAATNKEYSLSQDQIKATTAANDVLSDEILEILEDVDVKVALQKQAQETLAQAKVEAIEIEAKITELTRTLEKDLASVASDLDERQKSLPSDILAEFRRIVPHKGEETLAMVDDNTCGNCYQTITSQMRNELILKKPVYCKSCGSMLYGER